MLLLQLAGCLVEATNAVAHVYWNADGASLVGDGARDRLANPPRGIRAKPISTGIVEFLYGLHQPQVALLDQIQKGNASTHIFLGDTHYQPGIGLDQMLAGEPTFLDHALEAVLFFRAMAVLLQRAFGILGTAQLPGQLDLFFER